MDVSKIISISRKQTNTSTGQIDDATHLDYLNIIYKDFFARMNLVKKKYTWDTYPTDLVIDQNEYTLPQDSDTTRGLRKLLDVYVDYGDGEGERECKIYDTSRGIDADYTDKLNPYAINRDGSIFIYPAPDLVVSEGLRVEGTYMPYDLEDTTTSASIKVTPEYHDVLIDGLNKYIFAEKQMFDKNQLASNNYELGIQKAINEGSMDEETPGNVVLPDLSEYE